MCVAEFGEEWYGGIRVGVFVDVGVWGEWGGVVK